MGTCTSKKIKLTLEQLESIEFAIKNQDFKSITTILCELWIHWDRLDKEDQELLNRVVRQEKGILQASNSVDP
jgi:hypothetical protein